VRKIFNTVATRRLLLRLKCTYFDFGFSCALDLAGGLTALPKAPYLDLRGLTSKGREGEKTVGTVIKGEREKGEMKGKKGEGGQRRGKEREGIEERRCAVGIC